jgi:SAM-dependent methyltransferase
MPQNDPTGANSAGKADSADSATAAAATPSVPPACALGSGPGLGNPRRLAALELATSPAWQTMRQKLQWAWQQGQALSLVLSKPRQATDDLARVRFRLVQLKGGPQVQLVYSHATRDITQNLPTEAALNEAQSLLESRLMQAHAQAAQTGSGAAGGLTLMLSRKGKASLIGSLQGACAPLGPRTPPNSAPRSGTAPEPTAEPTAEPAYPAAGAAQSVRQPPSWPHPTAQGSTQGPGAHNRQKHRLLDPSLPFLKALGVMDAQGGLVPSMARKWKQINKFLEIYSHAHERAGLPLQPGAPLEVVDFGCGKGYLTFALHAWAQAQGLKAQVSGVELRPDLVSFTEAAARASGAEGLRFVQGDVRSVAPPRLDVMVALHACDVATDHAIHAGIRAQAQVILCSPCCHKEIRPQLLSPHPLRSVLQHGIHQGQQAEMLTDSLRALWLEAQGFDAQVFEFISLEHTQKNKMILAVRRQESAAAAARRKAQALEEIQSLKAFYGIRSHTLELLLGPFGL